MDGDSVHMEYIENTYEELTPLGDGADVMLVKHKGSGRIAVKKRIPRESVGIYRTLRVSRNPNLARVYDVCRDGSGCVAIEEFISGETLREKLEQGALTEREVFRYAYGILNALGEIHKQNIIHRDVKPENIMISSDGVAKLIDFGIARGRKEHQGRDTEILGTAGYAAPEQYGICQTGGTADLYAFGVVLNEMLTGKMPGEREAADARLREVVKKCVQIDPANRYQEARQICRDLECAERAGGKQRRDRGERMPDGAAAGKAEETGGREEKEDLSVIPGFRSGVTWKKRLACCGYVLMILVSAVSVMEAFPNLQAVFLEAVAVSLYVWSAFLAASNFGRWDRKVFPFTILPKELKVAARVAICILLMYDGFLLERYVKVTLLHLPAA